MENKVEIILNYKGRQQLLRLKGKLYNLQGTKYERQKGIPTIGFEIIIDTADLKMALVTTGDGRRGLNIYFRTGKNNPDWLRWCILESQIITLNKYLRHVMEYVEEFNTNVERNRQR